MRWYVIDKDYVSFLRQFDSKVEKIDYADHMKPYVGILLCVNGLSYFVPVSSPKPKHNSMSNGLDFIKLVDAKSNKLLGVLNLNNMIPVPEAYFTSLAYDKIDHYRTFRSINEQAQYISLLQAELDIIKGYSDRIQTSAQKLYNIYAQFPESPTSRRCCNFPLLEKESSIFLTGKPLPSKAVQPTSIQEQLQLAEIQLAEQKKTMEPHFKKSALKDEPGR